ncbi:MAG: T9SS type A sorting domain-containing protein, partial [Saprospiraceae bacterium]|nr:T9SS type A sorting domain-containing protein [Saprospiraceae bacterium]
SWVSSNVEPQSLNDGTLLFSIKLSNSGAACTNSDIQFADAFPTLIEIIDKDFNELQLISSPLNLQVPGAGCGSGVGCVPNLIVNPDPWNCSASLTADMLLNNTNYDSAVVTPEELNTADLGSTTEVMVDYSVNGETLSCVSNVSFVDNVPPVAVVALGLTVQLTTGSGVDPTARIYAEDIDNGSFDACSAVTLSPAFFDFDCSHIGVQTLILEVEDESGNTNVAWTNVTIEYKPTQAPVLLCPSDIVVNCALDLTDEDVIENVLGQATVDMGCSPVYTDVYDYDQNNDGDINDSFDYLGETVLEKYSIGCQFGPIVRTWSVPGINQTCQQIIIVKESDPFDGNTLIDWPYSLDSFVSVADNDGSLGCDGNPVEHTNLVIDPVTGVVTGAVIAISCEDDFCEEPVWDMDNTCGLIGVSVEETRFELNGQYCLTIKKEYTLIDWCVYDPFDSSEAGIWTWEVTANLTDIQPPSVDTPPDQELSCSDRLALSAIATDLSIDPSQAGNNYNCPSNTLRWQVLLDINNDWTYEREWSSFVEEDSNTPNDPLWSDDNKDENIIVYGYSIPDVKVGSKWKLDNASGPTTPSGFNYEIYLDDYLPPDPNVKHRVVWKAYDMCGNVTSVSGLFSVNASLDIQPPVSKCITFLSASLNDPDGSGPQQASLTVWATDFIASAEDNCSDDDKLKFSFSNTAPSSDPDFPVNENSTSITFTEADMSGNNLKDFPLEVYTWDESENSASCAVTLRLTSEENPCSISNIQCPEVEVDLDAGGQGALLLSDTNVSYANPCSVTGVELSFNPSNSNLHSLDLGCSDKGLSQYKVFVLVNGLVVGNCQNTLTVNDPFGTCPDAGGKVHFSLPEVSGNMGDQVCIPLIVDNFSGVDAVQGSLSWDETVLTYASTQNYVLPGMEPSMFGLNSVDNGEISFIWFDLTGSTPATLADGTALFDLCFDIIGEEGDFSNVQLSDSPTPVELVGNNVELEFTSNPGKVIVGSSDCGPGEDIVAPTPYCIANVKTLLLDPDNTGPQVAQAEIWAIDFDAGSFDNCSNNKDLRFTFTGVNPDNDPDFQQASRSSSRIFTLNDIPVNNEKIKLEIHVWDEQDNEDFCLVNLELIDGGIDPCYNNTEANIQWPLPEINLNETNVNTNSISSQFSPENLVLNYGFTEAETSPTYINTTCVDGFLYTFADLVIPVNGVYFKIVRTFTVLDWYTGNVYDFVQLIRNIDQEDLICDFLPNTAPVGDCISGHTLEDDVEWPADINITDHRIAPAELKVFSGVPSKDAEPVFYNSDADKYKASYIDILNSLSAFDIVLDRQWTVTRSDNPTVSWTYTQKLTVDITMFPNLVTVNTFSNRPIPNVVINQNAVTDDNGVAFVMTNEEVNPILVDNPINGLDIKDLVLIQQHVLGISVLGQLEKQAADLNNDQIISTIDIVELMKALVGLSSASSEWDFIDYTNNTSLGAQLRGHFIGIKPGDVDDSALLEPGNTVLEQEDLYFDDILLNAGETYQVAFYLENIYQVYGLQLHVDFDTDKIQITDMTSDVFDNLFWNIPDEGHATGVTIVSDGQSLSVGGKNSAASLVILEIKALDNTTLGESLEMSADYLSYMMLDDLTSIRFAGSLEGGIVLHTHDLGDGNIVEVYPNPVVDYMKIKLPVGYQNSDFSVEIFDLAGRRIKELYNDQQADLSDLDNGTYLYRLRIGDKMFAERFVKLAY